MPDIDWDNMIPIGSSAHSSLLVDITFSNNLSQVVRCPTRVSSVRDSLLDLVFLSEAIARNINISNVDGISDTAIVVCDLSFRRHTSSTKELTRFRVFTKADDVGILDMLEEAFEDFSEISNQNGGSVDKLWLFFKECCLIVY